MEDIVERAFLAVMNANDRELSLPLSDWAGRNLLRRRIAVAVRAVLPVAKTEEMMEDMAWAWLDSTCDEEPADIVYSADQMVDAFIAGMERAKGGAA
jgi:hypothetical protein